jgi:ankyrin repeat protein
MASSTQYLKDLNMTLIAYCSTGNLDTVITLLDLGADPCGYDGAALCHAAASGNKKIVGCLLNLGDFRRSEMLPSLELAATIADIRGKCDIQRDQGSYGT